MSRMNRREFVGGLTVTLLASPRAAEAQQAGTVYKIGFLSSLPGEDDPVLGPLLRGLRDLGDGEALGLTIPRSLLLRADEVIQ